MRRATASVPGPQPAAGPGPAPVPAVRVLEITAGFAVAGPLGGAARFVIELSRALATRERTRVAPRLAALWDFATPHDEEWRAQLAREAIPVFTAAPWQAGAPLRSCMESLRNLWRRPGARVDVIHSHGEFTDLAAILLKRRLGARYLVRTRHSSVEWPKRPRLGAFFANLLYPAVFDMEVAVSQNAVEALDGRWLAGRLGRKARRIYNALNFERFGIEMAGRLETRARLRASLGVPVDAPLVGTVGRLVPIKGYHVLLEAIPAVAQLYPHARFVIAGEGPERAALEAQAAALGMGERVIFTGARSDVEAVLATLDLFVSSSYVEGLPTAILESVAAGVPVVATAIPGNMEILQDGVTGRLAPPGDAPALAHAIVAALREPAAAKAMAGRAYQDAQQRFSIEVIAAQYADLFCNLMANAPGR